MYPAFMRTSGKKEGSCSSLPIEVCPRGTNYKQEKIRGEQRVVETAARKESVSMESGACSPLDLVVGADRWWCWADQEVDRGVVSGTG